MADMSLFDQIIHQLRDKLDANDEFEDDMAKSIIEQIQRTKVDATELINIIENATKKVEISE